MTHRRPRRYQPDMPDKVPGAILCAGCQQPFQHGDDVRAFVPADAIADPEYWHVACTKAAGLGA